MILQNCSSAGCLKNTHCPQVPRARHLSTTCLWSTRRCDQGTRPSGNGKCFFPRKTCCLDILASSLFVVSLLRRFYLKVVTSSSHSQQNKRKPGPVCKYMSLRHLKFLHAIHVVDWCRSLTLKSQCPSLAVAMASQLDDYALVDEEGEQALREQEFEEASPSTPDLPQWMTIAQASPATPQSLPEWLFVTLA